MNKKNEDSKKLSNIRDINTNPWLLHLIQLNDSMFPTGGYAHTFGMETYIQENVIQNEDDLVEFCDMYVRHNLASTDAIILKEAYRLTRDRDKDGLNRLENICNGIKLSPEVRRGSTMMGRQFLQTVFPLNKEDDFLTYWYMKVKNNEIKGHFPVIYGIYTALMGVGEKMALETFMYSSVAGLVQNAVRAVPLGQMSGVKTNYYLLPIIEETAINLLDKDLDDLNNGSISLEIASMKHEFLDSRLFIS